MNLLCPNCQKMLTVPEQYAGQLMKCPLCAGTFTVPALPPAPSLSEPAPALPPAPPPPDSPSPSFSSPDTYGVKQEPVSTPLPLPPAPTPPPHTPASSAPSPITPEPPPSPPKPPSAPPVGYTRTHTLWFNPKVLQWIPPVCVFLIFILQFFTWVGVFPGGVAAFRQGAWSAAFASGEPDPDLSDIAKVDEAQLSASVLTVFYLLLFLPTLVITIGVIVLQFAQWSSIPPFLKQLLPFRWGIVTVANLLVFFFLLLQLFLGFDLESSWVKKVEKAYPLAKDAKTQQIKETEAQRGITLGFLQRTIWLKIVVVLHLLAIISAGLMYWLTQRGPSRPLPKIELVM